MPPVEPQFQLDAEMNHGGENHAERKAKEKQAEEVFHPINPFAADRQSVFVILNGSAGNSECFLMP